MASYHRKKLKEAKESYLNDVGEEKFRIAQEYEEKFTDFKAKVNREKEDALERERERYEQKLQQQYERIETQFNKERERWTDNMKSETERIESFRKRDLEIHTDEIQGLKRQQQEELVRVVTFLKNRGACRNQTAARCVEDFADLFFWKFWEFYERNHFLRKR